MGEGSEGVRLAFLHSGREGDGAFENEHSCPANKRASIRDKEGVKNARRSALTALARERAAKPRYNINGRDCYNPADFGDVTTLLRAATPPTSSDRVLLRAANGHDEAAPETLLRAAPSILQLSMPTTQDVESFSMHRS